MQNVYLTSDLHFLHKRIVEFTNRKTVTTQELHDAWLVDLWNSQVNRGDTIYVLGDVSFGKLNDTANILSKLNGQICVVKGNHDRREDLDKLKNTGIIHHWYEYKELKMLDKHVVMFHYAIAAWHKQGYGALHAYGHSHGTFQNVGKSIDVGVDSSYNYFGKHKLFTAREFIDLADSKDIKIKDHHKDMTNAA